MESLYTWVRAVTRQTGTRVTSFPRLLPNGHGDHRLRTNEKSCMLVSAFAGQQHSTAQHSTAGHALLPWMISSLAPSTGSSFHDLQHLSWHSHTENIAGYAGECALSLVQVLHDSPPVLLRHDHCEVQSGMVEAPRRAHRLQVCAARPCPVNCLLPLFSLSCQPDQVDNPG